MLNRSPLFSRVLLSAVLASIALPLGQTPAFGETPVTTAQLAPYEAPTGVTYFALSLQTQAKASAEPHDILVLFDTSASQTGLYQQDALQALRTMLAQLPKDDRVALAALDLTAVPLTEGFIATQSEAMNAAIEKLASRIPLGATDLGEGLQFALESFAGESKRSRSLVYIGDGISRANILDHEEFAATTGLLVKEHVSISSFAIGPLRDIESLAALANHTGGMLVVDTNSPNSAQQAGESLAQFTQGAVIWPQQVTYSKSLVEVFPQTLPPLRLDRDTVLVGALKGEATQSVEVKGLLQGKSVTLKFTAEVGPSHPDFAYLPKLVSMAREVNGVGMPTLGSAGLNEVAQSVYGSAKNLADLGERVLATGDIENAKTIAQAAIERDPENPQAISIRNAIERHQSSGRKPKRVKHRTGARPVRILRQELLDQFEQQNPGAFLDRVEDQQSVQTQIIKSNVEEGLTNARERMSTDPEGAKNELKLLLDMVERTPDLQQDVRSQLRDQIESAIRESGRRAIEVAETRALAEENRAAALERQRIIEQTTRNQLKTAQLMARFNSLMDERRYQNAEEDVARQIQELAPDSPLAESTLHNSRLARANYENNVLRDLKHKNFVNTLMNVERAHVPFPDEPPIVYPDAEVWEELTLRRKKYASIDLAKRGSQEEKIYQALDDETTIEVFDMPLTDVMEYLEDRHGIQIEINTRALDDVGIGVDQAITRNLRGISLRSALRLILKELNLKYMVRDEVLVITTPEDAEAPENMVTKVYPVADLVLPITSGAGANPFMLGGGVGGQGGFGGGLGGGGGQQGGFFGGGGNQFGGGQGFNQFQAMEEDLSLGTKKQPVEQEQEPVQAEPQQKANDGPAELIEIEANSGETLAAAWNRRFAAGSVPAAAIRETVRIRMNERKFDEVTTIIQAALRNGQPQPWMYEAMSLSMQAGGAPQEELERALMSAIDFSNSQEEMMHVAQYLAHLGLDSRALKLYREISHLAPYRPEPYLAGLASAKRLDDLEGIQWACVGILSQAWRSEHSKVEVGALRTAEATLARLNKDGKTKDAKDFERKLSQALTRDCYVKVTWTGDADIDLLVEEPSGSVCSLRNPTSTGGGVMLGDAYSAPGGDVDGFSEVYVCPQAFSGEYRMLLRKIWGEATAGKVAVDIYTHYGTPQQVHIRKLIPLGEKDAMLVFNLEDGRRHEPLAEHQVANIAQAHQAVNRAVLAQQLASVEDSQAVRQWAQAWRQATQDGRRNFPLPLRRGGVGYQPVVTTLPEGANMTATAVISADRRYVRISAVPLFSQIGNVTVYNINTGIVEVVPPDDQGNGGAQLNPMGVPPPVGHAMVP